MIIVISITLFFIVLRFTVTLFNFISNPKLTRVSKHYHDLVSILIPARNEEENIASLLESIKVQDYKDYEVIVYDDESSDKTYSICSSFAAIDGRFRAIKGGALPPEWLGKNHACHQLAANAKGSYFLFLDADDHVAPGLINSAVHRMQLYNLSLLSLFPDQNMPTIGEKVAVPLLHYLLLNLLPVRLIFLSKTPSIATACGQFMLFDAGTYVEHQWHSLAKDKLFEDAEIMRQVKSKGYRGEVLLANGMISCRMYRHYGQAIAGFSKNALSAFNDSIAGLMVYILLMMGGPMIVLMTLNPDLVFFMAGLIALSRVMISMASRQRVFYNLLLHPVQMFNLTLIAFLSIQKNLTRTNTWKGRAV
ncbi:MAG TPA: glycosyltransferase [Mucilaginibacter sp.]|nr:glycosyltransferase [Mucilaginibacter sp.]